jgi:hypothetical protein
MANISARYEFRTWSENLAELRDKLQQFAPAPRTENSRETYMVSPATDKTSLKIRNQKIDIKVLQGTERGLELWEPVLKNDFPLDRFVIVAHIFPAFGMPPPPLTSQRYSMQEFTEHVIRERPEIAVVAVSKTRLHFSVNACQAEFASVTIDHIKQETVAVESEDPDAVLSLTDRLGIAGVENTNYVRRIKQLLKLPGSPD